MVPLADYLYYLNVYLEINNYISYIHSAYDKLSPGINELSAENKDYFRLLTENTHRLISLGEKLSGYLENQKEFLEVDVKKIDITTLLFDIHGSYLNRFHKKGVVVGEVTFDDRKIIEADKHHLSIMLVNIFENILPVCNHQSWVIIYL